jgi:small Trp-rich protein
MWLLGIGLLFILMKWVDFGPVGSWSWIWVVSPFIVALLWFELFEPMLGLDKKKAHSDVEKIKEERVRKALERKPRGR